MGTPRTLRTEKNAAISDGELSLLLDQFHRYMASNNLSDNTISAYLWGVRAFFACYPELNQNNASLYKADLMERYRPQTVNMRIRALNCFLKSQDIHDYKIPSVRLQQKSFIDHVISQADYEYLKNRLWEDEKYTFYFIVRFIASTGVRVSELVALVFTDVQVGYRDLYSKGNKTRRIYILLPPKKVPGLAGGGGTARRPSFYQPPWPPHDRFRNPQTAQNLCHPVSPGPGSHVSPLLPPPLRQKFYRKRRRYCISIRPSWT